jgi:hypothetical protein
MYGNVLTQKTTDTKILQVKILNLDGYNIKICICLTLRCNVSVVYSVVVHGVQSVGHHIVP